MDYITIQGTGDFEVNANKPGRWLGDESQRRFVLMEQFNTFIQALTRTLPLERPGRPTGS